MVLHLVLLQCRVQPTLVDNTDKSINNAPNHTVDTADNMDPLLPLRPYLPPLDRSC